MDTLSVHTTVSFEEELVDDELQLNGSALETGSGEQIRISRFLDLVRSARGLSNRARVLSRSNFPTASGLASSAAGFAALAHAASAAAGLSCSQRELSLLARQGSGSACRAVLGGFVEWQRGERPDGEDCYAEQLAAESYWSDLRILVCLVAGGEKALSSRAAMENAQRTSPLFGYWTECAREALPRMRRAISEKDFGTVGRMAEASCLQMHATVFTSHPPYSYWTHATGALLQAVVAARCAGVECYFTADAGPHVKILCKSGETEQVLKHVSIPEVASVTICAPGPGSALEVAW